MEQFYWPSDTTVSGSYVRSLIMCFTCLLYFNAGNAILRCDARKVCNQYARNASDSTVRCRDRNGAYCFVLAVLFCCNLHWLNSWMCFCVVTATEYSKVNFSPVSSISPPGVCQLHDGASWSVLAAFVSAEWRYVIKRFHCMASSSSGISSNTVHVSLTLILAWGLESLPGSNASRIETRDCWSKVWELAH